MGYVTVEVDTDDVISEISDTEPRNELRRREERDRRLGIAKAGLRDPMLSVEPWAPAGLAEDLRKAFYNRDASRLEALLCVLEKHEAVAA